jgi:hypothetical protein
MTVVDTGVLMRDGPLSCLPFQISRKILPQPMTDFRAIPARRVLASHYRPGCYSTVLKNELF